MVITIDGPVASGKSSVANSVAHKLNIIHLNSGFLYRGLSYVLINYFNYKLDNLRDVDNNDIDVILINSKFEYSYQDGKPGVSYNGVDITGYLKNDVIDKAASVLSSNIYIRSSLLKFQRNYADNNSIVVDGRDAGSVVFPNADFKIYLTALPEVRAERWLDFNKKLGKTYTFQQALQEVNDRDQRDKNRAVAPLIVPDGAVVVDNSNLDLDQTLNKILSILQA